MESRLKWLSLWHKRLWVNMTAHYRLSEKYEKKARFYTKLNIIFAIAVLFFANSKIFDIILPEDAHYGIVISIAGLGTVLTSALQYINRYEERAALHKLAASEYSILRRQVESHLTDTVVSDETFNRIQLSCDFLAKHCPVVESRLWRKVSKISPIHVSDNDQATSALINQINSE